MEIVIRPAAPADAGMLHERCFRATLPYPLFEAHLRFCLTHPHIVRLVALADGEIAGCGELTQRGRRAEIAGLVVAPAYRRRGIGRRLLAALLDEARRRGAGQAEINARAAQPWLAEFYGRLGFASGSKCRLPQSLGGEEFVTMSMTLSAPPTLGESRDMG
jgi:GNAT superfamily N-acetyltransferase